MRWTKRTIAVGIAVALLLGLRAWLGRELPEGVFRIAAVELAPVTSATPPPAGSSAWRRVELPSDWQPRGDGRDVWCRAELFLREAPASPLQLFAAQAAFGADVFVNGDWIAQVGEGPSSGWGRRESLWIPLPADSLRAGSNGVVLRLHVRPEFAGYLTPIWIGPAHSLQGEYRVRSALIEAPDLLALASFVLSLSFLSLYRRDARAEWRWLGLGLLVAGIAGLPFRTLDFWVWPLGLYAFDLFGVVAVHRAVGISRPRFEAVGLSLLGALALCAVVAPALRVPVSLAALACAFAAIASLLSLYRKRAVQVWQRPLAPLKWGIAASLVMSINDLPMFWNQSPWLGQPLLPLVLAPVLAAGVIQLTIFLSDAMARSRELNRSLQASQARLVEHERIDAAREERQRMQRDLHDGLGAQLVSALAVSERTLHDPAAVQRSLRGALGELRVAVDSLDGDASELSEMLGRLRPQIDPLLEGTGVALRWRVASLERPPLLSPQQSVHLLRIVQEAIANAVKHAGARTVEISCGEAERAGLRAAFVAVADDGHGIRPGAHGRGLSNMRSRANQLRGELAVESSPEGTHVVLWLVPGSIP